MNSGTDTDAGLAAMLAGTAPADDGFSARLVARLPRRRSPWRHLLLGSAAVAGVLPAFLLPAPAVAQVGPSLAAAALALAAIMAAAWLASESFAAPRLHS